MDLDPLARACKAIFATTYFGAGYYQASTAQWTTPDSWRGTLSLPDTLHRYAYVGNHPTAGGEWYGWCAWYDVACNVQVVTSGATSAIKNATKAAQENPGEFAKGLATGLVTGAAVGFVAGVAIGAVAAVVTAVAAPVVVTALAVGAVAVGAVMLAKAAADAVNTLNDTTVSSKDKAYFGGNFVGNTIGGIIGGQAGYNVGSNLGSHIAKPVVNPTIPSSPVSNLPRTGSATKLDPYHAFPDMVDDFAGLATKFEIPKRTGGTNTLYQLEGGYNIPNPITNNKLPFTSSKYGVFEWIVDNNQVVHRLFIPDQCITGIPNNFPK